MNSSHLKDRTKAFAIAIVKLVEAMPRSRSGYVIGNQLMRAGTSVAANYRSACRARSRRDFISKMGIVEEEADETDLWLEFAAEARVADLTIVNGLRKEAEELLSIVVASIRTARRAPLSNPQSAIRNPQCS
ncbi:MAG TPA: four helix bundle protein [Gemmatimonadales bacterium]